MNYIRNILFCFIGFGATIVCAKIYGKSKRIKPFSNSTLDYDKKTLIIREILSKFPGALREEYFIQELYNELFSYSDKFGHNTLVAISFCCDEINRNFESELTKYFSSKYFIMGGLAGFPFGGQTSFKAFAHHIPQKEGAGLVVFGPHVGVDKNGVIGKMERKGHYRSTFCCSSANLALEKAQKIMNGESIGYMPQHNDLIDGQQSCVTQTLLFDERLNNIVHSKNPGVELPRVLFEAQKQSIIKIIETSAPNNVPLNTPIALVGGIHINTPDGVDDFFLPLLFEIRNSDGKIIKKYKI